MCGRREKENRCHGNDKFCSRCRETLDALPFSSWLLFPSKALIRRVKRMLSSCSREYDIELRMWLEYKKKEKKSVGGIVILLQLTLWCHTRKKREKTYGIKSNENIFCKFAYGFAVLVVAVLTVVFTTFVFLSARRVSNLIMFKHLRAVEAQNIARCMHLLQELRSSSPETLRNGPMVGRHKPT